MPTQQRPPDRARQRHIDACPYIQPRDRQAIELRKHHYLHPDGLRLITTWFERAWSARGEEGSTFEAFVFAWISVNAWAACVTGQDRDREYMDRLVHDTGLRMGFDELCQSNRAFRDCVEEFFELLPIFKAQQLRRLHIRLDERTSRSERIQHYLREGLTEFEPECAQLHMERGEPIPRDWPHFIQAVYRVRCNLFHGEKSAHSEMDRRIVSAALLSLTTFFRGVQIL